MTGMLDVVVSLTVQIKIACSSLINVGKKMRTLYFTLFNDYSTYKYIESCNGCIKNHNIRLACDMLGRGIKLSKRECDELVELISDRDDTQ